MCVLTNALANEPGAEAAGQVQCWDVCDMSHDLATFAVGAPLGTQQKVLTMRYDCPRSSMAWRTLWIFLIIFFIGVSLLAVCLAYHPGIARGRSSRGLGPRVQAEDEYDDDDLKDAGGEYGQQPMEARDVPIYMQPSFTDDQQTMQQQQQQQRYDQQLRQQQQQQQQQPWAAQSAFAAAQPSHHSMMLQQAPYQTAYMQQQPQPLQKAQTLPHVQPAVVQPTAGMYGVAQQNAVMRTPQAASGSVMQTGYAVDPVGQLGAGPPAQGFAPMYYQQPTPVASGFAPATYNAAVRH
eukprot:NODE_763_length_1372_cov_218.327259.p1 GENE.NODE_763_length_1372_cov_218.327259~~NODE_763_length_1372_cov_218.327259.p1  ORF type:complete len:293 (+),score=93.99 NODE_763_length_1372_cov_218.327259:313-1191(+)